MRRRLPSLLLAGLFGFVGCGGPGVEAYAKALQAQQQSRDELAEILTRVDDAKSMAAAQTELDAQRRRFEESAAQLRTLPPPSAAVMKRLGGERMALEQSTERLQAQVRRILQLPGGETFFRHFGTSQPGLFQVAP